MSFATGKRIIITGANSGIGFETTRLLASFGAEIIMVCRSKQRGEAARRSIIDHDPDADLTLCIGDLSSQRSTSDLIGDLRRRYTSIHVLINNAGALVPERRTTEDGLEYTFALNHMGCFRLTLGLLDLLQAGSPSRVVTVSSDAHRFSRVSTPQDISRLPNPADYRGFRAYCDSKLANILFTRELAHRYADRGITAATLHPGFIRTNFGGNSGIRLSARLFRVLAALFAAPPERGAATPVYLSDAESIHNGMYYRDCRLRKPSATARSTSLSQALWDLSTELRGTT